MSVHKACPDCPDGKVWNSDGPTCKVCPTCGGHAALNLDGSLIAPRVGKGPKPEREWDDDREEA